MKSFPRPVVVISRCLEFESVRYNGQVIRNDLVRELEPFVRFVPVCPEAWAVRFQVGYLPQQNFLRPYPEALMSVTDSGKGRLD